MGNRVRIQRDYRVTVRLTEHERKQLVRQMEESGYLSMSKYLRIRCLDGKGAIVREKECEESDVGSQINIVSSEIKNIGENYNKVVRDFRKVLPRTKRNGEPMLDTRSVTLYLQQLTSKTIEVKALMEHMIEMYEESRSPQTEQQP